MAFVKDFWDGLEKKHVDVRHALYYLKELDKIPSKPGLYSWHASVTDVNFEDYYRLFKQKRVKISIEGNLKDSYKGNVKSLHHDRKPPITTFDFGISEFASVAFCPPLYIGISIDLGKRLNEHFTELEKIVNGTVKLAPPSALGVTNFDTTYESAHFAQRLGHTIHVLKNIQLSSLFIKTIEIDRPIVWGDLQKVEKYLNRTFIPIYGKR